MVRAELGEACNFNLRDIAILVRTKEDFPKLRDGSIF